MVDNPTNEEHLVAQLEHEQDSGDFESAVATARSLRAWLGARPDTPAWRLADTERLVSRLEHAASLPRAVRDQLVDAVALANESARHYASGRFGEGLALAARVYELERLHFGDESQATLDRLGWVASFCLETGDLALAAELNRIAHAGQRKLLGPAHPETIATLNNLGRVVHEQGDCAAAELHLREAVEISHRAHGEDDEGTLVARNNLAIVLRGLARHDEAESLLREILAARRRRSLGDDRQVPTQLNNLAALLSELGRYGEAEPLLREALQLVTRNHGPFHPMTANAMHNLAVLLRDCGRLQEARALFAEALDLRLALLGSQHADVARNLVGLARTLAAAGAKQEAVFLLEKAAATFDAARLRVGSGLARATFQASPYPHLASARFAIGKLEEAWIAAERSSGRLLADLLVNAGARPMTPEEKAEHERLESLLTNLESAIATLTDLARQREEGRDDRVNHPGESASPLQIADLESAKLAHLAAEGAWSAFQRRIGEQYPVEEGRSFPLSRVQAALLDHSAVLGWLDVENPRGVFESLGYVLRRGQPVEWKRVSHRDRGLAETNPPSPTHPPFPFECALRDLLVADAATPFQLSSPRLIESGARALWNERIAPLLTTLDRTSSLVIIPSGAMLGIPVEVLMDPAGEHVGDRFSVSYAPSATVHTWLAETRADRRPIERALLVGDPTFESEGNEQGMSYWPRIGSSQQEIEEVAKRFAHPTILTGKRASTREISVQVESGAIAEFDVIHFATHAITNELQPERSALVLSLVPLEERIRALRSGERGFSSFVTVKDILRAWRIGAELVTLSGCRTGLGRAVSGEGYIGLAHAFLQVGARSVLVSLWRVDDEATSLFMGRFYWSWLGPNRLSKANALQEAKRWLRHHTVQGRQPFAHPHYWSAFVLFGDPA